MSYHGHIENGVVVFDEAVTLPEGTEVCIEAVGTVGPQADWDAAIRAAGELENYDFSAWQRQRECDLKHAHDHMP